MTSTSVMDVKGLYAGIPAGNTGSPQTTKSSNASFTQIMQSQNEVSQSSNGKGQASKTEAYDKKTEALSGKPEVAGDEKDVPVKETEKNTDQISSKIEGSESVSDTKEVVEDLEDIAENVLKELEDSLGIPAEDILKAMEELGMTMLDLLQKNNLTALVVALGGESDMMSLVTNDGLYQSLQNILGEVSEAMGELAGELGISEQELEGILQKAIAEQPVSAEELVQEPVKADVGDSVLPSAAGNAGEEQILQEAGNSNKAILAETVNTTEKTVETVEPTIVKDTDTEKAEGEETVETLKKTAGTTPAVSNSTEEMGGQHMQEETTDNKGGKSGHEGETNGQNLVQFMQESGPENKIDELFKDLTQTGRMTDAENIFKQVADYMKIQLKPEMTALEMQLHPASLGTIGIQVASKSGIITAEFIAQNENVKAALESQMVQLRETLEAQGVKVEAVEVTVASHEFERNLEQNQEQNREGGKSSGGKRKAMNLSDLEGMEEEELEESEKIQVDMMRRSGNSVDYSA